MSDNHDQLLHLNRVVELLAEVRQHSDRELALVGAAAVEVFLTQLLRVVIRAKGDREAQQALDEPTGALYSFSSKIQIGYCFGFLSATQKNDLTLVRKIRNRFAHSVMPLAFDDEPIRGYCSGFQSLSEITQSFAKLSEDELQRRVVPTEQRVRAGDPGVVSLKLDVENADKPRERFIGNLYGMAMELSTSVSRYSKMLQA